MKWTKTDALVAASAVLGVPLLLLASACEQEVVVGPNDVPPGVVDLSWRFVAGTSADPDAVVFAGDSAVVAWAGDAVAVHLEGTEVFACPAVPPPPDPPPARVRFAFLVEALLEGTDSVLGGATFLDSADVRRDTTLALAFRFPVARPAAEVDTVTVEVPARYAVLLRVLERLIKEGNDSLLAERVLEFPAEIGADSTLEFEAPWVVKLPRFEDGGDK